MPPPNPYAVLLRKAQDDARLATKLVVDATVTDEHVGFFCQQAVEKAIKSVLARSGVAYRRTHDLEELMDLLRTSGLNFPPALSGTALLTPFAVEFRYDDLAPERNNMDVFDRAEAVRLATLAVEWALSVA